MLEHVARMHLLLDLLDWLREERGQPVPQSPDEGMKILEDSQEFGGVFGRDAFVLDRELEEELASLAASRKRAEQEEE